MKEKIKNIILRHSSEAIAAKEITALIQSEYYEKDFTEFCIMNVIKNRYGIYAFIEERQSFNNLEAVHDYWLKEVKGVKQ